MSWFLIWPYGMLPPEKTSHIKTPKENRHNQSLIYGSLHKQAQNKYWHKNGKNLLEINIRDIWQVNKDVSAENVFWYKKRTAFF